MRGRVLWAEVDIEIADFFARQSKRRQNWSRPLCTPFLAIKIAI